MEKKDISEKLKFTLWGVAGGAAGVLAIGFLATGWLTLSSTAENLAQQRANDAVVAALGPICVERLLREPDATMHVTAMKDLRAWDQRSYVQEREWAPVMGVASLDRRIANECATLASELDLESPGESAEL